MPNTDDALEVYNAELINQLNAIKDKSDVSYEVMAYAIGLPYSTVYSYMNKTRELVRSDYERKANTAILVLKTLVARGILPLPPYRGRPPKEVVGERFAFTKKAIDDVAAELAEKIRKRQGEKSPKV